MVFVMPHKNAIKQLQTYGPLSAQLDNLEKEISASAASQGQWNAKLGELIEYFQENQADLRYLIQQLSRDHFSYNRELAASILLYLWEGWKILPYKEMQKDIYVAQMQKYARDLDWTLPILERLLEDKCSGPVELAIRVASEMDYASPHVLEIYRPHVLNASKSKFSDVRLAAVQHLAFLYPNNDQALHVLDELAMDCLIASTKDLDINVRDWACFVLWLYVDNLDEGANNAFRERIEKEHSDSEVYMEAVIGMARLTGDLEVGKIIRKNLEGG